MACTSLLGDFSVGPATVNGGDATSETGGGQEAAVDAGSDQQVGPDTTHLSGVTGMGCGDRHTCAIDATGRVLCWGRNDKGQLGVDPTLPFPSSPKPHRIANFGEPGQEIKHIAVGYAHNCVVDKTLAVWCWGDDSSSQVGDNNTTDLTRFVSSPFHIPKDSAGGVFQGDIGIPHTIAAGKTHSCAVTASGGVACWGDNTAIAAAPDQPGVSTVPVPYELPGALLNNQNGSHVATGLHHSCAHMKTPDQIYCWGANGNGQIGRPQTDAGNPSQPLVVPLGAPGVGVVAGDTHACALDTNQHVWCWGHDDLGQAGQTPSAGGSIAPTAVPNLAGVVEIAAGGSTTCAVKNDHTVACWGDNSSGQLGRGTKDTAAHPDAVNVTGLPSSIIAVTVGTQHVCAVASDDGHGTPNVMFCWGSNLYGELGNGQAGDSQATPQQVLVP